jgi:uncharacterized membrane protein YbhN (UPF0104 family)
MTALPLSQAGTGPSHPRLAQPAQYLRRLRAELAPGEVSAGAARLTRVVAVAVGSAFAVLVVLRGHVFVSALAHALHANWSVVAAGAALEIGSLAGYVLLLHRVVSAASPQLRLRDSCDITLAGAAATRLLPTAGLGGAAVTLWALRSHGVRARELAERLIAFLVLLYGVYMGALVLWGGAVAIGLVHVPGTRAIGLVAVAIGAGVPVAVVALAWAPGLLTRALGGRSHGSGRLAALASRGQVGAPALRGALTRSLRELRRPHPALAGALAWWGFDIAVLFAMLHAFGASPSVPVLILGYFLGTLFNVVPLPGALSGGLAGMLVALGVHAAPAIAAVLAYRAVAVWLPAAMGLSSLGRLRGSVAGWRRGTADAGGYGLAAPTTCISHR